MTNTSGPDNGGGSGSGESGGSPDGGGGGGPNPFSAAGGRLSSWWHEKVLKEPKNNDDDEEILAKNSGPKPQTHQSGSTSPVLSSAVVDRANELVKAHKRDQKPVRFGPKGEGRCSDFVQQVLTQAGAKPGENKDGSDRYGQKVLAAEARAGDVLVLPASTRYSDGGGSAYYDTGKKGHVAIITGVNGNIYTVVDQDGDAKNPGLPTTHTFRIIDTRGVEFFHPVYP